MPYETTCPRGHRLQVSDSHLGQRIQCPACNESFVVPDGSRIPSASPRNRSGWTISPDNAVELARLARWTGRPLVVVGLLLVLLSRGCDAINRHAADRAAALADAAVKDFDDDLQFKKKVLQNEIEDINGRDDLKADDRKRVEELRKELATLDAQAIKDRRHNAAGEWHELAGDGPKRQADLGCQRLLA